MKKTDTQPKVRRGTVQKVIETPDTLAILQVPVVYYPSEPDEAYLEAKTVKFFSEARKRTKAGDVKWLKKHGAEVYVGSPA